MLELRGTVPGKYYPVEYSTNLLDWVLGNTAASISTNAFVDLAYPATPRIFFRARED
ncbi:MAG: hypothetical protein L0Z50_05015 [Verrucomicrobiales bacterium]|nr:hypothetical protein [Verrucomicrobiales bacterium]